jgi:hypothetical protein
MSAFGSALHATKPSRLLHFDFIALPFSNNGTQYVLVIKDDMSGFCILIDTDRVYSSRRSGRPGGTPRLVQVVRSLRAVGVGPRVSLHKQSHGRFQSSAGWPTPLYYGVVGRVASRANKLALQWRGPQRIVRAIHDYTYEVQGLNPL